MTASSDVVSAARARARALAAGDAPMLARLQTYRMPMTQFWVQSDSGRQCLAGHAGPRLPDAVESDQSVVRGGNGA